MLSHAQVVWRARVKVYTLAQDVAVQTCSAYLRMPKEMIVAHAKVYYMHWYSLRNNCITRLWYTAFHLVINGP